MPGYDINLCTQPADSICCVYCFQVAVYYCCIVASHDQVVTWVTRCGICNGFSSSDNYVHRLVQNKGDGKLVEVMAGQGLPSEEKVDSLQLEVCLKGTLIPSWSSSSSYSTPTY